jgi:hypothetical protein
LQLKGERWYSPDLGRFVSEDPIQDGSNWYAFAGNNPVTYADPTGLYQQGHPLQGGGRTPLAQTTTFTGFVGAGLGNQILGGGFAPVSRASAPIVNRQARDASSGQVVQTGALRNSLQSQLTSAQSSLANRSFYEFYDKSADRARIASLTDQLVDAVGRHSAARSNHTQLVNGWQGQQSMYGGYQYESTAAAFGSGLGTGGKAVGNSFGSTLSLGYYDGPFTVTQQVVNFAERSTVMPK